ncbi:MAG: hypothetical protein QMB16_05190 [Paracoccaceae bacterium]
MAGFIYIMANASFPDAILIGQSTSDPTNEILNHLNQAQLPSPYFCQYFAFVENIESLFEELIISLNPHQNIENSTFFNVSVETAVTELRRLGQEENLIKFEEILETPVNDATDFDFSAPQPNYDAESKNTAEVTFSDNKGPSKTDKAYEKRLNDFYGKRQRELWIKERRKISIIMVALVISACVLGYRADGTYGALIFGGMAAVVAAYVIYSFNKDLT